jgi:uncharacterized protein YoxC
MSAIDEVVTALQSVIDGLDDVHSAATSASHEAEEGLAQAAALGVAASVAALGAVKDSIDRLTQQISATTDTANEVIGQAKVLAEVV